MYTCLNTGIYGCMYVCLLVVNADNSTKRQRKTYELEYVGRRRESKFTVRERERDHIRISLK